MDYNYNNSRRAEILRYLSFSLGKNVYKKQNLLSVCFLQVCCGKSLKVIIKSLFYENWNPLYKNI